MNSLKETLQSISIVKEIRGIGMMVGIEINQSCTNSCLILGHGIIALSAGEQVMRLLPPLQPRENETKQLLNHCQCLKGTRREQPNLFRLYHLSVDCINISLVQSIYNLTYIEV